MASRPSVVLDTQTVLTVAFVRACRSSHLPGDRPGTDIAEVTLDRASNVLLMDPVSYDDCSHGRGYRYEGGYARKSPVRSTVPKSGHWHIVVDLGGGAGQVRAFMSLLSEATV